VTEVELPSLLESVVLDCLAKDPEDRPASAAALARRLEAIEVDPIWTEERAERWWQTHKPERGPAEATTTAKLTKVLG
jgi:PIN domain nuclease of toxin-antitoxin system